MTTFERSPELYAERYLYGAKQRISRNLAYGSQLAEGLENGEASGDPLLDLVASRLPKFELMDRPVEDQNGIEIYDPNDKKNYTVPFLVHGKERIPILAKPDTTKADYSAFKEYKTSVRKWTQKMCDESGQVSFYATAIWLTTKKIPTDIEFAVAELRYDEAGRLEPTGNILRFRTRRTMSDVIKMTARVRRTWDGIGKLVDSELL